MNDCMIITENTRKTQNAAPTAIATVQASNAAIFVSLRESEIARVEFFTSTHCTSEYDNGGYFVKLC